MIESKRRERDDEMTLKATALSEAVIEEELFSLHPRCAQVRLDADKCKNNKMCCDVQGMNNDYGCPLLYRKCKLLQLLYDCRRISPGIILNSNVYKYIK
jgi:hypothetical protein